MTSQRELIPMRPGDILRYQREQMGLTIEMASRKSRIKPSILAAIESGETREIPSVYLRGHIRHYARFLGIDPADIEEQMEHVQGAEPEVRAVFAVNSKRNRAERWLKASSYLAASALIAVLAWQFTHQAVRFSQGNPDLATAAPGQDEARESAAEAAAEDRQISANSHINASIASVEMLKQGGTPAADANRGQAGAATEGVSETNAAGMGGIHKLSVLTSADTWVEIVDAAGEQLELDLIRGGTVRDYSGLAPFRVMIGRASAVELTMDGEIVDLGPHTNDDVARLTLGAVMAAEIGRQAETNQH